MFSIHVDGTFLNLCLFSTQLIVPPHCYIQNTWLHKSYFPSLKHNVMWIRSKVTVNLIGKLTFIDISSLTSISLHYTSLIVIARIKFMPGDTNTFVELFSCTGIGRETIKRNHVLFYKHLSPGVNSDVKIVMS